MLGSGNAEYEDRMRAAESQHRSNFRYFPCHSLRVRCSCNDGHTHSTGQPSVLLDSARTSGPTTRHASASACVMCTVPFPTEGLFPPLPPFLSLFVCVRALVSGCLSVLCFSPTRSASFPVCLCRYDMKEDRRCVGLACCAFSLYPQRSICPST